MKRGIRSVQIGLAGMLVSLGVQAAQAQSGAGTPSPEAQAALRLVESKDRYEQQVGFLRLEALREPATAEAIRSYTRASDAEVRAYSLRALAAIEGLEGVPGLLKTFQKERSPRVRGAILLALEPLQGSHEDILPLLIKALKDRHQHVRMTAIDIVSRIDDSRAREAIRERARRERSYDVRRLLKTAMERLGEE